MTEQFLRELTKKRDVTVSLLLVDGAPWLQYTRT